MLYTEIKKCRICGNKKLISLIDLGQMTLTGIFPKSKAENVGAGPLELVKCDDSNSTSACGLVQLKHNYDLNKLYGEHYGYRSGLNKSMVEHLHNKVKKILKQVQLNKDDMIIDIGSNDSTTLQAYPKDQYLLLGIDPTGKKFKEYYPEHIKLIPDFFSAKLVEQKYPGKKAKIITSISMFYDLEQPLKFVKEIYDVLDTEGVWVFEQSYMPTMLERYSYDTICHEHLEYYALKQIKYMLDKVGFKLVDIGFNNINGGSFSLMVAKRESKQHPECIKLIEEILNKEKALELDTLKPYKKFKASIDSHRQELIDFLKEVKKQGKKIYGYGASTKGNVILQYCAIKDDLLPSFGEVNQDKYGSFTPGTLIPIISEKEIKAKQPEYLLVLPWHFKDFIIQKEQEYLRSGGKLVFPLPDLQIISL